MIDLKNLEVLSMNEMTTEVQEVARNVRVVLSTVKGQVALNRDFGMDADLLDLPLPDAESYFLVQAIEQLRINEPRAAIQSVDFEADLHGKLTPKVVIEFVGEST